MTFTTQADRARSISSNGGMMKTPDHLTALIHKPIKRMTWKSVDDRAAKVKLLANERKRREKLASLEIRMKGHVKAKVENAVEENDYLSYPFRMKRLISVFCRVVDVDNASLISKSKRRPIAEKRQILMWILEKNTKQSSVAIGRALGNRDHSTVLHGISKIEKKPDLLETAKEIERAVLFFEHQTYGGENKIKPESIEINQAAYLWRKGRDTKQIADKLNVHESVVHNNLTQIKKLK